MVVLNACGTLDLYLDFINPSWTLYVYVRWIHSFVARLSSTTQALHSWRLLGIQNIRSPIIYLLTLAIAHREFSVLFSSYEEYCWVWLCISIIVSILNDKIQLNIKLMSD